MIYGIVTDQGRSDRPALMRHNQRLTYEELRRDAEAVANSSGKTRKDIASDLGVSAAAVTLALGTPGGRYAELQMKIIERYSKYRVEKVEVPVTFRVLKK